MKRKAFTAALLSAVLLLTVAGALLDKCSAGDLWLSVEVSSPENGGNYGSTSVPLRFSVFLLAEGTFGWYYTYSAQYSLDGGVSRDIIRDVFFQGHADDLGPVSFNLTELSEGMHFVEVTATGNFPIVKDTASSGRIYFTVDLTAPRLQFVSSQQQTFSSGADTPFNFTCFEDEGVSWLGYRLDEGDVVTVTDNVTSTVSHRVYNYQMTLDCLSNGAHSLMVYAKDLAGNTGESEAFNFTVGQETQPEPEQSASEQSFPTVLIAFASALVAVVGIALLIYFKKKGKVP